MNTRVYEPVKSEKTDNNMQSISQIRNKHRRNYRHNPKEARIKNRRPIWAVQKEENQCTNT